MNQNVDVWRQNLEEGRALVAARKAIRQQCLNALQPCSKSDTQNRSDVKTPTVLIDCGWKSAKEMSLIRYNTNRNILDYFILAVTKQT